MTGCNKMLTKIILVTAVILTAFFILSQLSGIRREDIQENSGIPDVVSSRIQNEACYLTVAANSENIEDRKKFAERVICMYRENTFYTTRFSTDREDAPKRLYITVYLNKSDVKQGKDVFSFLYDVDRDNYMFE